MTRSPVRVRNAEPADVSLILSLVRSLADYEKLSHEVSATEEQYRRYLFETPRYAEVLIAEWENQPAGFAAFFHNFSTFLGQPGLYLEDLFVVPECRGHGIGRALLRAVADIAISRGCARVEWAVLDWNEPAIAFYRRIGAAPLDNWTTFRLAGRSLEEFAKGT